MTNHEYCRKGYCQSDAVEVAPSQNPPFLQVICCISLGIWASIKYDVVTFVAYLHRDKAYLMVNKKICIPEMMDQSLMPKTRLRLPTINGKLVDVGKMGFYSQTFTNMKDHCGQVCTLANCLLVVSYTS